MFLLVNYDNKKIFLHRYKNFMFIFPYISNIINNSNKELIDIFSFIDTFELDEDKKKKLKKGFLELHMFLIEKEIIYFLFKKYKQTFELCKTLHIFFEEVRKKYI